MAPQIGGDFEEARTDIEQLPLLDDAQSVALHALERIQALIPSLPGAVVNQARARLMRDRVKVSRASLLVGAILTPLRRIYTEGASRYVEALVEALDACAGAGHYLARFEAVRALRDTANRIAGAPIALDEMLAGYSESAMVAAHVAPRLGRGLFVMTAHQAKGKEFDAVVIAELSSRFWPDDEEHQRLFYVAVTRATSRWTIVAPETDWSPLLRHIGQP